MILIGIDTGVNTGYAEYDTESKKLLCVTSMKIHQAMNAISQYIHAGYDIKVMVEDPRQRTWFGTEKMSRDEERKRLQGVGSVKRDAGIWEDFLIDKEIPYEMVAPKRNVTKLKSNTFNNYTKFNGRTNEHGRDAAMLVFGY